MNNEKQTKQAFTVESFHAGYNDWYETDWLCFSFTEAEEKAEELLSWKGRICRWEKGERIEYWEYENGEVVDHY